MNLRKSAVVCEHVHFGPGSVTLGLSLGSFERLLGSAALPALEAREGIPKNLSSQVLGEVRVNFLG